MAASPAGTATILLTSWRNGDEDAGRQLISVIYQQLHDLARACLSKQDQSAGMQPTALVNELYLSLFSQKPLSCENRLHFLGMAARQMRNLVIDDARRRKALKRGGTAQTVVLDDELNHTVMNDGRLEDLNEALERLEVLDERCAKVVELRFFGGLTEEEIAASLAVSVPTVKRDWQFARSWLLAQIGTA